MFALLCAAAIFWWLSQHLLPSLLAVFSGPQELDYVAPKSGARQDTVGHVHCWQGVDEGQMAGALNWEP